MRHANWVVAAAAVAWLGCASTPESGESMRSNGMEGTLDRTVPPRIGAFPELDMPPVARHRLSNGLEVLIVEQHDLPVADVELVVRTGAGADAAEQAGRATLVAELLDEGTASRSALELAEAVDYLGAELDTRATWDASSISLHVLEPRLEPALELMADVVLRPAFPEAEVRRVLEERRASILQQQDEPRALASKAFAAAVYGAAHPYGAPLTGTRETVDRLDRAAIEGFYRTHYRPNNAFLVVVGDVDAGTLLPLLERHFGAWEAAPVPETRIPAARALETTTIHLVDKPGAAQSEIRVGHVGPSRATPDYFPLMVLNTVLGGAFTSRLNMELREERGWTYGAGSRYDFRRAAGPFTAGAAVFTAVTDSALRVVVDEIRRIREEPIPAEELERARNYLALGLPRKLETTRDIAHAITEAELYGLGGDYLERYVRRIRAVTPEAVHRAAQEHLSPDRMALIVVGDRAVVEEPLRALGLGPVVVHEAK